MDFEATLGAAMMAESADIFARHQEHQRRGDVLIEDGPVKHPVSFFERRAKRQCDRCFKLRLPKDLKQERHGRTVLICRDGCRS